MIPDVEADLPGAAVASAVGERRERHGHVAIEVEHPPDPGVVRVGEKRRLAGVAGSSQQTVGPGDQAVALLRDSQSFRLEDEVGEVVVVVELDPPVERDHQIVVAQQMALSQEDVVDLREVGGVIVGNRAESRREDQQ